MSGEYHRGSDREFGHLLRGSRDGRGYGELLSFLLPRDGAQHKAHHRVLSRRPPYHVQFSMQVHVGQAPSSRLSCLQL